MSAPRHGEDGWVDACRHLRHGEGGWELVDACRYREPGCRAAALDVTALEYERLTPAGDIERATRVRVNGEAPADSQLPWGPW